MSEHPLRVEHESQPLTEKEMSDPNTRELFASKLFEWFATFGVENASERARQVADSFLNEGWKPPAPRVRPEWRPMADAPESQPLTEEERAAMVASLAVRHDFVDEDGISDYSFQVGYAQHVIPAVETLIATRTAALLDRLKAAEGERDDLRIAMGHPKFTAFVAKKLRTAEADKARAVAEAKVALLDEVERRLKVERNKHYVLSSPPWSFCHDADISIVRALREEVSGRG